MQHFRNFTLLKYFIPRSVSCNSTMIKCNKVEDEDEYGMKVHLSIYIMYRRFYQRIKTFLILKKIIQEETSPPIIDLMFVDR